MDAARGGRHPPLALEVRLARPTDRTAVLGFATTTWDGWDYIPEAWDPWLAATDGVVLVACPRQAAAGHDGAPIPAGRPVAMTRVALLAAGEAWLEGIRVDPAVRGRDVATNLQVAALAWAAAHEARVVRYATGERNEGSLRLGARHGFRRLADRRAYGPHEDEAAPGRPRDASALRVLPPDTTATVVTGWWHRIAEDPTFVAGDGLYEARAWAFQALDEARFAAHVRRGDVAVARDDGAVLVTRSAAGPAPDPQVALLAGAPDAALSLLADLRRASGGEPRLRLPDPDPPLLRAGGPEAWARAGLAPHTGALCLLARGLDAGSLPSAVPPAMLVLGDRPRPIARPGW